MSSATKDAAKAWRRLNPELAEKRDHIAEIIDPSGFAEFYDGIGEDAERLDTTRMQYKRSRARRKAMEILRYLGEAPETTDWEALFKEMLADPPRREDAGEGVDDGR